MKVLVTGARGLVGGLVVRTGRPRHDVRGLGRAELDVSKRPAVARAFDEIRPQAVIHCAAFTDVDKAETDPRRAMAVNAEGSQWVAEASARHEAILALVSTDYVFDGEASSPYREGDRVHPLSAYGKSKLEAERRVEAVCRERHIIVRTGWLYGDGKGFVDWARDRLETGQDLPLVVDQTGSPTCASDLAEALWVLVEGGHRGLFHFVNRGETTWLELGRAVAEEIDAPADRLRPISLRDLARPAPRPRYSPLSVERYQEITGGKVAGWREALARYLSDP